MFLDGGENVCCRKSILADSGLATNAPRPGMMTQSISRRSSVTYLSICFNLRIQLSLANVDNFALSTGQKVLTITESSDLFTFEVTFPNQRVYQLKEIHVRLPRFEWNIHSQAI